MSREHRRPLAAFVVVALLCGLFMGYSWRAQAQDLLDVIRGGTTITQQVVAGRHTLRAPAEDRQGGGAVSSTESDAPDAGQGPVVPERLQAAVRKVKTKADRARTAAPAAARKDRIRQETRTHAKARPAKARPLQSESAKHTPRARRAPKHPSVQHRGRHDGHRQARHGARHDRSDHGHAHGRHARAQRSHRGGNAYGHADRDRPRGHAYGRYAKRDRSDRGYHRNERHSRSHRGGSRYGHHRHHGRH